MVDIACLEKPSYTDYWMQKGYWVVYLRHGHFWNPDAGETTDDDPRLPPLGLDSEWEYCLDNGCQDIDWHCKLLRHKGTGETTQFDPRMSIEALKERGVNIVALRWE
ncbi:hypothetical protein V8F33_013820 [Rhypophila sp. PSN 637]